jgi:hypothetical protein
MQHMNVEKVEKLGFVIYKRIHKCLILLQQLYENYPDNNHVLRLYGTFLAEVYNDTEKGTDLVNRAD